MQKFISRNKETYVKENLEVFPAVAILGPRQCGKSTLAKMLAQQIQPFLYLDLQNREDLSKLQEPELFFRINRNATICLDEIQLIPNLFSILRSEIDAERRNGRFILLGSASRGLVQHTSESLAGRVGIVELTPFTISEINSQKSFDIHRFWFRGGYPDSFLAASDSGSRLWTENFLKTYVERDINQFGLQISSRQVWRMLQMIAHIHGQIFNASKLGESMGVTHPTVKRYLDLLEETFVLRTLPPFEGNLKKRLIKSPKVYVRDSGILHRILQINDFNNLMGHPVFGPSWEGLVVENIISSIGDGRFSFFRTASGDEVDLIMQKGTQIIAIECKATTAPQITSSFRKTLELINPDQTLVIAPVQGQYPAGQGIIVSGLSEAIEMLKD